MQCLNWFDVKSIYPDILKHGFRIEIENDMWVMCNSHGNKWTLKENGWLGIGTGKIPKHLYEL